MKNNYKNKSNLFRLFYLFFFFILLSSQEITAEERENTKELLGKNPGYENVDSYILKDEISEIKEGIAGIKKEMEGKGYVQYAKFITIIISILNIIIIILIAVGGIGYFKVYKDIKSDFKSELNEEIKRLKKEMEENLREEIRRIVEKLGEKELIVEYLMELYSQNPDRKISACEQLAYRDKDGLSEMALQKIADDSQEDDRVKKKASWALEQIKAKRRERS